MCLNLATPKDYNFHMNTFVCANCGLSDCYCDPHGRMKGCLHEIRSIIEGNIKQKEN